MTDTMTAQANLRVVEQNGNEPPAEPRREPWIYDLGEHLQQIAHTEEFRNPPSEDRKNPVIQWLESLPYVHFPAICPDQDDKHITLVGLRKAAAVHPFINIRLGKDIGEGDTFCRHQLPLWQREANMGVFASSLDHSWEEIAKLAILPNERLPTATEQVLMFVQLVQVIIEYSPNWAITPTLIMRTATFTDGGAPVVVELAHENNIFTIMLELVKETEPAGTLRAMPIPNRPMKLI